MGHTDAHAVNAGRKVQRIRFKLNGKTRLTARVEKRTDVHDLKATRGFAERRRTENTNNKGEKDGEGR